MKQWLMVFLEWFLGIALGIPFAVGVIYILESKIKSGFLKGIIIMVVLIALLFEMALLVMVNI